MVSPHEALKFDPGLSSIRQLRIPLLLTLPDDFLVTYPDFKRFNYAQVYPKSTLPNFPNFAMRFVQRDHGVKLSEDIAILKALASGREEAETLLESFNKKRLKKARYFIGPSFDVASEESPSGRIYQPVLNKNLLAIWEIVLSEEFPNGHK